MSAATPVINVTAATFEAEVIEASRRAPVIVDFWAAWCGPCRMLGPVLEALAAEAAGAWTLAKIDTDQEQALAARHDIRGIPAVKAFVNGVVVDEFTGVRPEAELRRWLAGLAPSPAEAALAAAEAALAAGDDDGAIAQVREALQADPRHPGALLFAAERSAAAGHADEARALLARLPSPPPPALAPRAQRLVAQLATAGLDIEALLAAVAAQPRDLEARWTAALALQAADRLDEALSQWLEIVQRDRKYRDDGARKAMLEVFAALGPQHPLTRTHQRRLQMALF